MSKGRKCQLWPSANNPLIYFITDVVIHVPLVTHLYAFNYIYSKTSIARTRIARIPDRWNTLADSMFRFFAILNSYYCCGGYFYKPESPEVRIEFALRAIQTCKNGPHYFELSRFNCTCLHVTVQRPKRRYKEFYNVLHDRFFSFLQNHANMKTKTGKRMHFR